MSKSRCNSHIVISSRAPCHETVLSSCSACTGKLYFEFCWSDARLNSVGLTLNWILLVWRQMTPGFSQHPRGDNFPALTYLLCYNDSVFFKTVSVFRTLKTCFRSHLLLTVVTSISIENTEEKYKEDYLWIYCCIKPIHNQLAWIGRWSSQVKTDS